MCGDEPEGGPLATGFGNMSNNRKTKRNDRTIAGFSRLFSTDGIVVIKPLWQCDDGFARITIHPFGVRKRIGVSAGVALSRAVKVFLQTQRERNRSIHPVQPPLTNPGRGRSATLKGLSVRSNGCVSASKLSTHEPRYRRDEVCCDGYPGETAAAIDYPAANPHRAYDLRFVNVGPGQHPARDRSSTA